MTEPTAIERLAAFTAGLDLGHLDPRVIETARLSLIDTIGVMIAGSTDRFARAAAAYALATRGAGPCRLVAHDRSAGALGAALANGVAAHVLDFDDSLYQGMSHPSAAILPAVLAAADATRADGSAILAGLVAGLEVSAALGSAFGNALYERGGWTTGLLGAIAAAAGAARTLGLDEGTSAQAIALATCQAAGTRAVLGSEAKPYLCGRAAEAGIDAALAARIGIEAPLAALEGRPGLARLINDGAFDFAALDGLGEALARPIVGYKRFPVCSSAQAPVEAVLDIMHTEAVKAQDVSSIECTLTPFGASCLPHRIPTTPTEARFSLPFALACALANATITPDHLSARELARPRIHALMARVALTTDAGFVPAAEATTYPEAARIVIVTRAGTRFERTVLAASSLPPNRASLDATAAKFRANVEPLLGERASVLLERLTRIESATAGESPFA
ncbi:MAG: MmgE/PrpD family protein [Alphaproteobacteria bacterium]|nr:MmgE/PrpD family protein [Alphaproteobacteria bacterium]